MDRAELSESIIAELGEVLTQSLRVALPALLAEGELGALERAVQGLSRQVWGRLVERVLAAQAAESARPARCTHCQGGLRRRERTRTVEGLVGTYTLRRAAYWCARCGYSVTPADERAGVGPAQLSPGLARVVARAALEAPFAQATEMVAEATGVRVDPEVARRVTEGVGALVEAAAQARVAQAQAQRDALPSSARAERMNGTTALLAVAVDGVQVHHGGAWHELKVGTLAPLGPGLTREARTGRAHLCWGTATYVAGVEDAEAFWWRVYAEACRRGLRCGAVRTVVVLGDGAAWIWQRAAHFLGSRGVEVIEIVDIYHAYGYLWAVADTLYGAGTPQAAAWVAPLKEQLYTQGATTVLAVLARLAAPTPEAAESIATAQHYFTTHAARMDYPRFVARQFPIGSGAVESACKCLIAARLKEAGMRWGSTGAQALASLRALHRSGEWAALWQHSPLPALRPPTPRRSLSTAPTTRAAPPVSSPAPPLVPRAPAPPFKPRPQQRPLILPRSA